MQHVSTYNSHLQAKLRTVIALQGGCVHLGSHMAYSVITAVFNTQCDMYLLWYNNNNNNNNNNNIFIYLQQLGCHPVAVVILHVHKT